MRPVLDRSGCGGEQSATRRQSTTRITTGWVQGLKASHRMRCPPRLLSLNCARLQRKDWGERLNEWRRHLNTVPTKLITPDSAAALVNSQHSRSRKQTRCQWIPLKFPKAPYVVQGSRATFSHGDGNGSST
eukprot:1559664-Amphidinium_carterae.1